MLSVSQPAGEPIWSVGNSCGKESPHAPPFLQSPLSERVTLLHTSFVLALGGLFRCGRHGRHQWCELVVILRVCLKSPPTHPSTPPVSHGLCLFLVFRVGLRPVSPALPHLALNHHLCSEKQMTIIQGQFQTRGLCSPGSGQGGHRATAAGFLRSVI